MWTKVRNAAGGPMECPRAQCLRRVLFGTRLVQTSPPWFRATEAGHLALSGERRIALGALSEAIGLGYRDPLLGIDPAFAELHGDPAFQAQIHRMTELINIERAKLGMVPLQ